MLSVRCLISNEFHQNFFFALFQASAYGSPDGVLTEDMMDARIEEAVRQHKQKVEWHSKELPGEKTEATTATTQKNRESSVKRTQGNQSHKD